MSLILHSPKMLPDSALVLAMPRLSYSLEEVILLIVAGAAFVLTLISLRRRARVMKKSEE